MNDNTLHPGIPHSLHVDIANSDSNNICYILLPEGLKRDCLEWMNDAARQFSCNIAVITGIDWNNDLTPWKAKGVFKKEKDFGGNAAAFLKHLTDEILPGIEKSLNISNAQRTLVGISLSGLFAIWASAHTDKFCGIASISGSLWFDDFTSRFQTKNVNPAVRKFFILLGEREKNSKNSRMATVEDATDETVTFLKSNGFHVYYILDEGTHFSPIVPRLQKALSSLY